MQSTSLMVYFQFGTGFRYLKDAGSGYMVHGDGYVLVNINSFLSKLEKLSLVVTQLTDGVRELKGFAERLKVTSPDFRLDDASANDLKRIIMDIDKTLKAELAGKLAFIVTDKRIDVMKLLFKMNSLFPVGVFERLPAIAKYDLNEAGKCIAFERPTAAAFHLLRGTEAVLRDFYCSLVKRGRASLMWGPIVSHLRTIRKPPDKTLLNNLDNIRESFRNPTQHPEKIYDIDEVQDLFGLCCDVICRMIKAIK
jgi:hypothetical protein